MSKIVQPFEVGQFVLVAKQRKGTVLLHKVGHDLCQASGRVHCKQKADAWFVGFAKMDRAFVVPRRCCEERQPRPKEEGNDDLWLPNEEKKQ